MGKSKSNNAGCLTLSFWLFIGWWLYPMKWIFWDLPRAIIRTVRKQNVRHESGEQEITPIIRDSRAVGSRNSDASIFRSSRPQILASDFLRTLPYAEVSRTGEFRARQFAQRDLSEFKCKTLTARSSLKNFQTFVAFDTETTGIDLSGNRIIEVACVRFVNFTPTSVFTTLINPGMAIPPESTAVHHITDSMVLDAPKFYEIIPSLEAFIEDATLVAHNAPFDVRFLYADGLSSIADKKVFDTLTVSRKLCKDQPNHKLETCCNAHNISIGNAHRSAADAMACGLLFVQLLIQQYNCRDIDELRAKLNT